MNKTRLCAIALSVAMLSIPDVGQMFGARWSGFLSTASAQNPDDSTEGDAAPADGEWQDEEAQWDDAEGQPVGESQAFEDSGRDEAADENAGDDPAAEEVSDATGEGGNNGDGDARPEERTPPPAAGDISAAMVEAHARARAAVGVPPLAWSSDLAAHAQEWTDHLARDLNCSLKHRTGATSSGYGENLYATSGTAGPAEVVGAWDAEKAQFDAASNACNGVCGHYTQVVWRNSREVGCAVSNCPSGGQVWACNYNPPGNYSGERPF